MTEEKWQPWAGRKSDWGVRAKEIVALGYPAVSNHLGDLLVWLQDMNWPGSRTIADFLVSVGAPLIPHIKEVFAGNDGGWQSNILTQVAAHWPKELISEIEPELTRFTWKMFDDDDRDIDALRLLIRHKLGDQTRFQREIGHRQQIYAWRLKELNEIEGYFSS